MKVKQEDDLRRKWEEEGQLQQLQWLQQYQNQAMYYDSQHANMMAAAGIYFYN